MRAVATIGDCFHRIIVWGNSVAARFCLFRQIDIDLMIHLFFPSS